MTKPAKSAPRFVLSPGDLPLMLWLDEWRVATVPLLARLSGTSTQAVYHRLKRLGTGPGGLGYIEGADVVAGWHRCFYLTRRGQQRIESPYAHSTPQLSRIAHDLAVAQVCGVYGTADHEGEITSERAVARDVYIWRSEWKAEQKKREQAERRGRVISSSPMPPPIGLWISLGEGRTHAPDAVIRLTGSGDLVAIEAELHTKDENRLRGILTAYADDCRFKEVLYVTGTTAIARKVETVAADINATAINTSKGGTVRVRVTAYEPLHSVKPLKPIQAA